MRTRFIFAITIALVGVIGTAAPASAHAELIEASPGPAAVLESPPSQVVLVFNEPVQPTSHAVDVSAPDGSRVSDGDPIVDPSNVLTASVRALAAGAYTVSYRVIAEDSHVVEGSYQFSVAASEPATTQPDVGPTSTVPAAVPAADSTNLAVAPASRKEDDSSPFGVLLVVVAAVIGVAGGLTAWWMNRGGKVRTPGPARHR